MNAHNQNKIGKNLTRYKGEGDTYTLLFQKFADNVKGMVTKLLKTNKKLSEEDSNKFTNNMFTLGQKREKDIKKEIKECYDGGDTIEKCANKLINKYYKITKVNKYQNTIKYQTDRNLAGEGEVTEVVESVTYKQFKKVPISLLWNFINKINNLNIKFIFDTTFVRGIPNSLNNKNYILYLETKSVSNKDVFYEFQQSKILSNVLNYLSDKYDDESKFYIGFDNNGKLHFGIVFNNKKYKIGYTDIKSYHFKKIIPHIKKTDEEINLDLLSRKFVTNIRSIHHVKDVLKVYFNRYEEIETYVDIIDDKFTVVVKTYHDDIINLNYIDSTIKDNIKLSHHIQYDIKKMKKGNITNYYFLLKNNLKNF